MINIVDDKIDYTFELSKEQEDMIFNLCEELERLNTKEKEVKNG